MLKNSFKELSNNALKNKDTETRRIMGNILAKFLEIEKSGTFSGWNEQLEQDTIRSYIKSLQKSIEQLKGSPLIEGYQKEIDVLSTFLPKALSKEETLPLLLPFLESAKSTGQLIGLVMKEHRGKVDPEIVKQIASEHGLK